MLDAGKKWVSHLLLAGLLVVASASLQAQNLPEFTDLIENSSPAVVKITTTASTAGRSPMSLPQSQQIPEIFRELFEQDNMPERHGGAMGSGFVISEDGYILTNNHVIESADEITVRFSDQREYKAELVGSDSRSDLALLKIDADKLPLLKFAKADSLRVGQWVVAIGSPFGLDYSASAGIVSAIGRNIPSERNESNYVPFIQTDVAINPGNSGGPLFNLQGEVVGINSQIYTRGGGSIGLSFAIPSSVAEEVVDQLREKGRVDRGWLGVVIQGLSRDLASSYGLDKPVGALIADLEPEGPAAKSGMQAGDLILKFNGRDVKTQSDLPFLVGQTTPDSKVPVEILRKGKKQTLQVQVGVLQVQDAPKVAVKTEPDAAPDVDKLGLVVEPVTEQNRGRNSVTTGVLVRQVKPDSPAAHAGLMAGDVIDQLAFSDITTVEDYRKVADGISKNAPQAIRFFRNGRPVFHTITLK